jgi:hypothetical protein
MLSRATIAIFPQFYRRHVAAVPHDIEASLDQGGLCSQLARLKWPAFSMTCSSSRSVPWKQVLFASPFAV